MNFFWYISFTFILFPISGFNQENTFANNKWIEKSYAIADSLFESSLQLKVWEEESPGIFSHYLTGHSDNKIAKQSINKWINGEVNQSDIQELHRGEFISLLASFEFSASDSILFSDIGWIQIQELLDYEKNIFTFSDTWYFNEKESIYGQEFGWILKGFNGFLSPLDSVNPNTNIADIALHIISIGINKKFEEGTHDLEALGIFHSSINKNPNIELGVIGDKIQLFVDSVAVSEIQKLDLNGQAYSYSRNFDGSVLTCNSDYCQTLDNLNKQAHLMEWLVECNIKLSEEITESISKRFYELLLKSLELVQRRLDQGNQTELRDILIISSTSHSRSVLHKIKKRTTH